MTLTLGESWPAWHPTARRGTLETDGVLADVLVLLAPYQPSGVARARERAAIALRTRGPGILGLLDIRAENNRIAWVYQGAEAVALSRLPDDHRLGPRAIAELLRRVGQTVVAHPGHPGPEPDDVLIDTLGDVQVISFARPFPGLPSFSPPEDDAGATATVYRLGALFAFLLGASRPAAGDPDVHEATTRRTLENALHTTGTVQPELVTRLGALLAYEPAERPDLDATLALFAQVQERTSGPTLADVCARHVQRWLTAALGDDPDETTLPQRWDLADLGAGDPTAESALRLPFDANVAGDLSSLDDPTVDSELGAPLHPPTPSAVERGSIPVAVGPPPEVAARPQPTLPYDLFEPTVPAPHPSALTSTDAPTEGPAPLPPEPPWLRVAAAVLAVIAVGLSAWLLFG